MNTRIVHKTSAIVIHSLDYGESDRIVSFYSMDFGKVKGIAKGALNPHLTATSFFPRKGGGLSLSLKGVTS
jgi:recombinational DNA repair protein (RecF pathway)